MHTPLVVSTVFCLGPPAGPAEVKASIQSKTLPLQRVAGLAIVVSVSATVIEVTTLQDHAAVAAVHKLTVGFLFQSQLEPGCDSHLLRPLARTLTEPQRRRSETVNNNLQDFQT